MVWMLISALFFVLVGSTFAESKNATLSSCKVEVYVLALQGTPSTTFGCNSEVKHTDDCKYGYDTIHGLWPDPESSCSYCTSEKFDESKLSSSTLSDMQKYWPTCQSGTNHDFWDHEWSKHGTCSGMSQNAYFSEAISLYKSYNSQCKTDCHLCFTPDFKYTGTSC